MENALSCLTIVVVWTLLSVAAGNVAARKGLEKRKYVLLSLLLSPLVGLILAAAATPDQTKADEQRIATGTERTCPFCAELVKHEAVVCRFCGKDLPPVESAPPPVPAGEPRFKSKAEYQEWKGIGGGGKRDG
jgi:hypothetical protein